MDYSVRMVVETLSREGIQVSRQAVSAQLNRMYGDSVKRKYVGKKAVVSFDESVFNGLLKMNRKKHSSKNATNDTSKLMSNVSNELIRELHEKNEQIKRQADEIDRLTEALANEQRLRLLVTQQVQGLQEPRKIHWWQRIFRRN